MMSVANKDFSQNEHGEVEVEIDDDVPTTPFASPGFRAVREPDVLAVMHAAEAIDEGHWTMRCPAHGGGSASTLEVTLRAGRYTLRCRYGCTPEQIIAAAIRRQDARCNSCEVQALQALARASGEGAGQCSGCANSEFGSVARAA